MGNGRIQALAAAAALVALGGLAGCGEKCNTEPVARVDDAQSCTVSPGAPVTVGVRLCPTCNQTGATCDVDVSQVSSGIIQIDPIVEACEDVTSCPSPTPSCQVAPLPCSFTAPTTPDVYDIRVYDTATNTFPTVATLTVAPGAAASCAFASASAP
jgi:hypothetical protein